MTRLDATLPPQTSSAPIAIAPTTRVTKEPAITPTSEYCPALGSNVASQLGKDWPPLPMQIANYLEQGKAIRELPVIFTKKQGDSSESIEVEAQTADLAGNGNQDVIVTIRKGSLVYPISGAFVFRKCPTGKYSIHYISPDPAQAILENIAGVTVLPAQLLADNSTQLIVSYGSVQSGRCVLETYLVVALENNSWTTYLNDQVGCGYRDITIVQEVNPRDSASNNRNGIMITGTRWTGWGVYLFASRLVNVYYDWRDDNLQFEKRVYLPSTYRFQVLEDAQMALDAGDLQLALEKYHQAATDNSLEDSLSWYEFETLYTYPKEPTAVANASNIAYQYQTAFANFRIFVLSVETVLPKQLQQMVQQLALMHPVNKPGHEFAELAAAFQKEFDKTGSIQQACQKVNMLVENHFPNLTGQDGHIGNWGEPGQGEFTVDVICPQT